MEGYLNPLYAESFLEIGQPLYLPRSKGWLIKRQIPGTPFFDAMGPYPLFFCENWDLLVDDLDLFRNELVSISLVIGPLNKLPTSHYSTYFDRFFPYKDHYLLDLTLPLEQTISSGRRKDARRAGRNLSIDYKVSPHIELQEWETLYVNLVERHQITGIRAFSHSGFEKQLSIPGVHFFRAILNGETIGGNLYIIQSDVAYFHLSAFSDEGYKNGAAYAVKWAAIQHFSNRVHWMNLGGSTSNFDGQLSGLDQFKKGWSSGTAKSFYCGKILNQEVYQALVRTNNAQDIERFPAYRHGDF